MNKSVMGTPPHPNKRGGPEPHKRFKRDGEEAENLQISTAEGELKAFETIVNHMPDIPGLILGGRVVKRPPQREDLLELL